MRSARGWLWAILGAGAGLAGLGVGCRGGGCESCFGCFGAGTLVVAGLVGRRRGRGVRKEEDHGLVEDGH